MQIIINSYCANNIMTEQTFPNVTVGALIFDDEGKIFLMKSPKWLGGVYTIPGGHIELGETMEKALMREIKEEVGLDVDNVEYLMTQEFIYGEAFYKRKHFIFVDFIAKAKNRDVKLDNIEATEYIWVTPEEALRINTEEYAKNMIKKYLENQNATNRVQEH